MRRNPEMPHHAQRSARSVAGLLLTLSACALGVALFGARCAAAAPGAAGPHTLPVERESWYAIRWQGALIGYSHFVVEESVELGSDNFYVINSESRVKLGPDVINDAAFNARLLVDRGSLLPSLFVCTQKLGQTVLSTECLFTPRLVAQKNGQGNQESSATIALEGPSNLYFNNVWGRVDTFVEHYVLLLAAWQTQGEKDSLRVYDPVLRGAGTLTFKQEKSSTATLPGKGDVPARVVLISDKQGPIARAWLAESNRRLLRLEEYHGGFIFSLSDAKVEAMLKKAAGVNLLREKLDFSNVYFPNANAIRSFRAGLTVKLTGHLDLNHQALGFKQSFDGTVVEGVAKGVIDVQTSDVKVKASTPYPRRAPYEGALAPFTQAEPGIESGDDEMRSKGEELAWRSRTSWEAATKINAWIHDKVGDGYSMPSARFVLQYMAGNSESKARLAVSLLRAVNIPARRVGGALFQGGWFVPHTWAEVWVGDEGWVAIDPSTGETGVLGATHVVFGDVAEPASLDVTVDSYAPTPRARVPFFTRELRWPVGQRRVYSIVHGGKEIGTETAHVKGLQSLGGKDVYEVAFAIDRTLDGKRLQGSSRLLTSPDVLPRRYTTEGSSDGTKWSHAYDFDVNVSRENVKVGDTTKVQETPMSEGVYLFDPRFMSMYALVVGQLPNPALGTKASIFVYDPETHDTREMVLQIRQEEKVGVAGEEKETWRCESTDGISFFIEKTTGQVIRIEAPRQDMVLQLVESATKL